MLVVVAWAELNPKPFTTTERAILGLVFAGALIQTYFMLFVIDGQHANGRYGFWSAGANPRPDSTLRGNPDIPVDFPNVSSH